MTYLLLGGPRTMAALSSRLGIVTGKHAPELSDGGQRLAAALADHGLEAEPIMWNDPMVDWAAYDAVLVRSCWDYPDDIARFQALLDELDAADVPVANPLEVLRWDLHKRYLLELADAGIEIPPTALLERGADRSLAAVLRERGWTDAVVKPAIGAMSTNVWRTSREDAARDAARFTDLLADQDVLVQAFVPEIATGERSIVCFGGEYSHAWNSLVAEDDITSFEGHDPDYAPRRAIREQALRAVATARDQLVLEPEELPYARVDYVPRDDTLVLMELELIEPYLGFERGPGSVERFAEALVTYYRAAD